MTVNSAPNSPQTNNARSQEQSSEPDNALPRVDPFPLDVFPEPMREIVNATHLYLQYPIDYMCAGILYATSLGIANTHKIEVKRGWIENAVLYIALVGKPGVNKSHPLTFAVHPIFDRDNDEYDCYQQELKKYWRTKDKAELERPIRKKFLLSDYTPEALSSVHRHNPRGIGVYVDELAGWFKNFNRYNKGSEEEFWNSNWSGKPINEDRKNGDSILIAKPFISVVGTIQPAILDQLASGRRNENGFIDRILFVMPYHVKKEYWSETDIPESAALGYKIFIDRLLNLQFDYTDEKRKSHVLKMEPKARIKLFEWQKHNTDLCNQTDDETLGGIYSKLDIYASRFALVVHMLRFACYEAEINHIDGTSIDGAIALTEYFRKMAFKVYTVLNNPDPLAKLAADKRKLYEDLPDAFNLATGLQIAKEQDMPQRTFKRFVGIKDLFRRPSYGVYERVY